MAEPAVQPQTEAKKRKKRFSKANIELVKQSFENRGIVYLGRVPPRMVVPCRRIYAPNAACMVFQDARICRRILSQFAPSAIPTSTNIDIEDFKERKQHGGCSKRGYIEGWVEFLDKKIAKKFVRRYNGQPIGGKKRNPFYEELWCVKYLSKFKWDHLLEGIRYRKMLYQREVQQELADAKRQQETYLNRVQIAKRLENSDKSEEARVERVYTQIEPIPDPVSDREAAQVTDELLALFGGREGG